MNITLRAGEKLYLNGAVIRVTRKVVLELMNDAAFLLESHIMQAEEATTPLRQIYFAVQVMLMDPNNSKSVTAMGRTMIEAAMSAYQTLEILEGLRSVSALLEAERYFEALKLVRRLYPAELKEMRPDAARARDHAA
jgi:flagellar protein FlbT